MENENKIGFMGAQYVWQEKNYKTYYKVDGLKVEQWAFELNKESGKYLPYAPRTKTISLQEFIDLKKVRPIQKIK